MGSVYQGPLTSAFYVPMEISLDMKATRYDDLRKGNEGENLIQYTPVEPKRDMYLSSLQTQTQSPYQTRNRDVNGLNDIVMGQPFQFKMYGKPEQQKTQYVPLETQEDGPFNMMVGYETPQLPIYISNRINLPLPVFDRQKKKKNERPQTIDATIEQPKTMKDLFKGSLSTLIAKELGELEQQETRFPEQQRTTLPALKHHHEKPMYLDGLLQPQLQYN